MDRLSEICDYLLELYCIVEDKGTKSESFNEAEVITIGKKLSECSEFLSKKDSSSTGYRDLCEEIARLQGENNGLKHDVIRYESEISILQKKQRELSEKNKFLLLDILKSMSTTDKSKSIDSSEQESESKSEKIEEKMDSEKYLIRCCAKTKAGLQCKKPAKDGKYCERHISLGGSRTISIKKPSTSLVVDLLGSL